MPSLDVDSGVIINGTVNESKGSFKEIKVNQEAYHVNMMSIW